MGGDSNVEKTDLSRWRMKSDQGRQTWHYLKTDEEVQEWPQAISDKYFLGLDTVRYFNHIHHAKATANSPIGPPCPPHSQNTPRLGQKWHRILLKVASRLGQLGMRVPRPTLPYPGIRDNNVHHQHSHPSGMEDGNDPVPSQQGESVRWWLGLTCRG